MSNLLIMNAYNKFMAVDEPIDFDQPFDGKLNVFTYTIELEEYCKKHEIPFYCITLEQYHQMNP